MPVRIKFPLSIASEMAGNSSSAYVVVRVIDQDEKSLVSFIASTPDTIEGAFKEAKEWLDRVTHLNEIYEKHKPKYEKV